MQLHIPSYIGLEIASTMQAAEAACVMVEEEVLWMQWD